MTVAVRREGKERECSRGEGRRSTRRRSVFALCAHVLKASQRGNTSTEMKSNLLQLEIHILTCVSLSVTERTYETAYTGEVVVLQ